MALTNSFRFLLLGCLLFGQPSSALDASAPFLETTRYYGGASGGPCAYGEPSGTGRYLAFACAADDIVSADHNGIGDTFVLDRQTRSVTRVSVDTAGNASEFYGSGIGFPSDDGLRVVFTSTAPLHPDLDFPYGDFGFANAFLRDRQAGTTSLVARDASGGYAPVFGETGLRDALLSRQIVLFSSRSNMVGPGLPPAGSIQLYLRNWSNGSVELVTARPDGSFSAGGGTGAAALSRNGRYVAFVSGADDLGPANPLNTLQLMLRDRQTQTTRRLSFAAGGGEFSAEGYYQGIAGQLTDDGRHMVVQANSDELGDIGAAGKPDIYLVNTQAPAYELVSLGFTGQSPDDASFNPSISGDGRFIAFFSRASNLLPTPQVPAIYIKDRYTGELVNVSHALGAPAPFTTPRPRLSADGSTLAFEWWHGPGHQLAGRQLVYTVTIRGTPPAAPKAVPALSLGWMMALALGMCVLGAARRASR